MKKLILKKIMILSDSGKSARQFEFGEHLTLITADDDNSVGKSTLAKMIFWTFGCEPIFSEVWRTLDCTSIIEFEINNAPYIIHRYKNEIKIRHSNGKLHSFPKITGDYSKYFSELVNFNVLLPKKGQLTLETPPPAYYFIPFYIDQKRTWAKPWDSFENLQQYSSWAKPVISYHSGLFIKAHFEVEKDIYVIKRELEEVEKGVTELNNAAIILRQNLIDTDNVLPSTEFIFSVIQESEKKKKNLLEERTNLRVEKIRLESQIKLAKGIISELDKDYIFSVENMEDGDIECPTCGTIHENSIAHRTSILIDMELAKNQLESLESEVNGIINLLVIKDEEITEQSNKSERSYNNVIESDSNALISFTNDKFEKRVHEINSKKNITIEIKKSEEKTAKKSQSDILSKEQKSEIKQSFADRLSKYITKLKVNVDISKIKSPLDYKKIYEVGGAAEDARAVLGYYLAIYEQVADSCEEALPPLVIDTPNQQEQASGNYTNIIKSISDGINNDRQYVICAMEHKALEQIKTNAQVIKLDARKILLQDQYEKISKLRNEVIFN
ncbi:hypothetical protein AAEY46_004227 [Yersinia enterocolitica]